MFCTPRSSRQLCSWSFHTAAHRHTNYVYVAMSLRALDVGQRIVTGGLILATGYLMTINTLAIYDLSQWALVRCSSHTMC